MQLYAGIDLHSTTNHIGIINEQDRRIFRKKLTNDPARILEALQPFKNNLKGVVVESTFIAVVISMFRLPDLLTSEMVACNGLKLL